MAAALQTNIYQSRQVMRDNAPSAIMPKQRGQIMQRYSNDPRWITAKYLGTDINGRTFQRGERIFYYPLGKRIVSGEAAEQASRDFEAACFDER
jgi:hypothetical protein